MTIGSTFLRGAQGMRHAANAAAVTSTIGDGALREGELVYVETFRDYFVLAKTSAATIEGTTVIATNSGSGRWERQCVAHPSWRRQATWFVDPVSGNDENTGVDLANAIKTDKERQLRWGDVATLNVAVALTYASSLAISDPVAIDVDLGPSGTLTINGTPTTVHTSTFTAVTAIDRAAQQPLHVTDGTQDWSTHLTKQLFIPSGARAGARAWVAKAVSAGIARLSPTLVNGTNFPTMVTPSTADPYVIRTLPTLFVRYIRVRGGSGSSARRFQMHDITFAATTSVPATRPTIHIEGTLGLVSGCYLPTPYRLTGDAQAIFVSCCYAGASADGAIVLGGLVSTSNGLAVQFLGHGGTIIEFDTLIQGGSGIVVASMGRLLIGSACAFDGSRGILLSAGCYLQMQQYLQAASGLWGTTASGAALVMTETAVFNYQILPTCNAGLGLGREIKVGVTDRLWSSLPYVDSATHTAAVIKA